MDLKPVPKTQIVLRSIYVPKDLDKQMKARAAEREVNKSKLYRIGATLILALIEHGRIPSCLIELLSAQGESELLEDLHKVVHGGVTVGQ